MFAMMLHDLVHRHTKDSGFSHLEVYPYADKVETTPLRTHAYLAHLVTQNLSKGNYTRSPAPACLLVRVPAHTPNHLFFTPILNIQIAQDLGAEFKTEVYARQVGEAPTMQTVAYLPGEMKKTAARCVDVVIYTHDESPVGDRDPMSLQWNIVSINAHVGVTPDPQHPTSMARNQLEKVGGSWAHYTADMWAHSVWFWSTHVRVQPRPSKQAQKAA